MRILTKALIALRSESILLILVPSNKMCYVMPSRSLISKRRGLVLISSLAVNLEREEDVLLCFISKWIGFLALPWQLCFDCVIVRECDLWGFSTFWNLARCLSLWHKTRINFCGCSERVCWHVVQRQLTDCLLIKPRVARSFLVRLICRYLRGGSTQSAAIRDYQLSHCISTNSLSKLCWLN